MTELKQKEYYHHQQKEKEDTRQSGTYSPRRIFEVDEGHRSKQTAYKYRTNFNHFLDFVRIHDLDVFLDLGKEAIQELVIKYVLSMRDNAKKRYARGTVNTRVAAILYFLDNNDIELNRRKIKRYFPSDESVRDDRPYTVEEIQRMLSVCDLRSKAMILLMASAGLRIGSLSSMKIGHLTEVNFQGSNLYKIQVYAGTRDRYWTFCTPECYNAIQEYLNFRKRYGEDISKDKSPLFRKYFNKDNPFTINVPEFLSQSAIVKVLNNEVLKKSGVKTSEAMRTHAFRKGFMSICERSGMRSINVKLLLGHSCGVEDSYYRPAESDLLEDYMNHAADALTIDPTKRLEKKVQDLEGQQRDEITKQNQEIDQLKERVKFLDFHVHKWASLGRHLMDEKQKQKKASTTKKAN